MKKIESFNSKVFTKWQKQLCVLLFFTFNLSFANYSVISDSTKIHLSKGVDLIVTPPATISKVFIYANKGTILVGFEHIKIEEKNNEMFTLAFPKKETKFLGKRKVAHKEIKIANKPSGFLFGNSYTATFELSNSTTAIFII